MGKTLTNESFTKFDKLIMGFKGKTLRDKVCRENFDGSLAICQCFPPSNFCAIQYEIKELLVYGFSDCFT